MRQTSSVYCAVALTLVTLLLLGSGCAASHPAYFRTVAVRGAPDFQRQVTNALALLENKDPEAYTTVSNAIGVIRQAKHSGMSAWKRPPTFDLANATAFYSLTWCAGSIAHDSIHSRLYHDYLQQNPKTRRVPDRVWTGETAEATCSQHQVQVLEKLGAPAHEINWCRNTNKYWEVKYRNRNW